MKIEPCASEKEFELGPDDAMVEVKLEKTMDDVRKKIDTKLKILVGESKDIALEDGKELFVEKLKELTEQYEQINPGESLESKKKAIENYASLESKLKQNIKKGVDMKSDVPMHGPYGFYESVSKHAYNLLRTHFTFKPNEPKVQIPGVPEGERELNQNKLITSLKKYFKQLKNKEFKEKTEVKNSTFVSMIVGKQHVGRFATQDIKRHTVFSHYNGNVYTSREGKILFEDGVSKHCDRASYILSVDGKEWKADSQPVAVDPNLLCGATNDCRNNLYLNDYCEADAKRENVAWFTVIHENIPYAMEVATKNIKRGEELYVFYGENYNLKVHMKVWKEREGLKKKVSETQSVRVRLHKTIPLIDLTSHGILGEPEVLD